MSHIMRIINFCVLRAAGGRGRAGRTHICQLPRCTHTQAIDWFFFENMLHMLNTLQEDADGQDVRASASCTAAHTQTIDWFFRKMLRMFWLLQEDADGQDARICQLPRYFGGAVSDDSVCGYWWVGRRNYL